MVILDSFKINLVRFWLVYPYCIRRQEVSVHVRCSKLVLGGEALNLCFVYVLSECCTNYLSSVFCRHEAPVPAISEQEFEEILTRNKTVSSSAISRAVQDASAGTHILNPLDKYVIFCRFASSIVFRR